MSSRQETGRYFQMISADESYGEVVVKDPGLTYGDYDSNGNPILWKFVEKTYSFVEYLYRDLQNAGCLLKMLRQFIQNGAMFTVGYEIQTYKPLFHTGVSKCPLYILFQQGHVGDKSVSQNFTYSNSDGETLCVIKARTVIFDIKTNELRGTPVLLRKKYNRTTEVPLILNTLQSPRDACSYTYNVPWSETGPYQNAYAYWYINYFTNAIHFLVNSGQLQPDYQDLCKNGIKRLVVRHIEKLREGDTTDIKVWSDERHSYILHFDLTRNGTSLCRSSFEFFNNNVG